MRLPAMSLAASALSCLVGAPLSAQIQFSNQTEAAGVLFPNTHSMAHDQFNGDEVFEAMVAGVCIGDFNRDGYPDIFQAAGGLQRDKLLINNGDGTFTDKATEFGVAAVHQGSGASVADFNGDGFVDIFVASHGPTGSPGPGHHILYRNNGGTSFTNVAVSAGVNTTSQGLTDGFGSAFGDYDLDGDLDLFVTGWRIEPIPALGNRLFRNNGDETFTDVTTDAGVEAKGLRGFSPSFVDMDGDLYPELLVTGDFNTSHYFKNNGDGSFTDVTVESNTNQDSNGMGSAIGDLNGDGLFDWYVTSIYELPEFERHDGNKLYLNQGNHEYCEVALTSGLDDGGWGWGAVMIDFDHDGDLDIAETNGWRRAPFIGEQSYLWLNDGTGLSWTEMGVGAGLDHDLLGRACLNFDYDMDGDQDLLISSNLGCLQLFRNDLVSTNTRGFVHIRLDTSANPALAPNGFGCRVRAAIGGRSIWRVLDGSCHFMGTSEMAVHFGLGSATSIEELEVFWPDGTSSMIQDSPINQHIVISAPSGS